MKTALITGANKGIGKAIAKKLSKDYEIIIHYRSEGEQAQQLLEEVENKGIIVQADLSKKEDIENMFTKIKEKYSQIDCLVNNASPKIPTKAFKDIGNEIQDQLQININAVTQIAQETLKLMPEGSIINILTTYILGNTPKNLSHYLIAKEALWGLTKSLTVELAPKIRVNAVSPSMIETNLTKDIPEIHKKMIARKTPLQRLATAEDIANAVSFLASEEASFITGVNLPVNGGLDIQQ